MEKKFASQADLAEKQVTFSRLSERAYAYTAQVRAVESIPGLTWPNVVFKDE